MDFCSSCIYWKITPPCSHIIILKKHIEYIPWLTVGSTWPLFDITPIIPSITHLLCFVFFNRLNQELFLTTF